MQESSYSSHYDPQGRTLAVVGAVDELERTTFRADLDAAMDAALHAAGGAGADRPAEDPQGPVVVDLSEVDYFPSVAVSVLVSAMKEHRGSDADTPLDVVVTTGCVAQRVLELCGIPHRVRGPE